MVFPRGPKPRCLPMVLLEEPCRLPIIPNWKTDFASAESSETGSAPPAPSRLCTPVVLMSYREACSLSQSVNDYQAPFWQELRTLLRTETKIDKGTKNFHRIFCDTNSWWNWLAWPFYFAGHKVEFHSVWKSLKKSISKLKWFEFIRPKYKPAKLKKKNFQWDIFGYF